MKTKTSKIIILMITLFAVMLIGATKVNAVEITDEAWNAIPNEISVNLKEIEYQQAYDILYNQLIEILKGKGVIVTKEDINISIKLDSRQEDTNTSISIGNKSKEIKVVFSNSADYSESEQQKLDNILKGINAKVVITPEISEILKEDKDIASIGPENYDFSNRMYEKAVAKAIEPLKQEYQLGVYGGEGGGGDLIFTGYGGEGYEIYKNDIFYGTIYITVETQGKLTIPSTVEDTETAIINYATPKIEEFVNEEAKIRNDGTVGFNVEYKVGDGIIIKKYNGDYYRVSNKRTQELIGTVLLKKEKSNTTTTEKEDTTTGIKVIGTFEHTVILESKKVEEQKTIDTVKKALPQTIYQWTVYDINLLRDGTKIQPNGKVKVYIPIPSNYNKEKLTIYRVDENGTTTEYKVTVETINGKEYATFETDHFSIYVLAETQATTSTTNKGEKDDTPKTGITDITNYIIAVAVISAVGIIALKKKETK